MLQSQTVEPRTLELLKKMMQMSDLTDFVLVGGTNLSLRLGHRLSIDLDLFSNKVFEPQEICNAIFEVFPQTIIVSQSKTMLFLFIEGIKVDIVFIPQLYIQPVEEIEGIRLASIPDIIAMKLNAIARRGVKKDFWDIAELLNFYSVAEMIEFFKVKYTNNDIFSILRSMMYFEDAEIQKDPDPLKKVTWSAVKKKVRNAVKQYIDTKTI